LSMIQFKYALTLCKVYISSLLGYALRLVRKLTCPDNPESYEGGSLLAGLTKPNRLKDRDQTKWIPLECGKVIGDAFIEKPIFLDLATTFCWVFESTDHWQGDLAFKEKEPQP